MRFLGIDKKPMVLKDRKLTASKQAIFEGHVNEDQKASFASAQDQTLLKALQDLIVRVVDPKQMGNTNQIHKLGPEAAKLIIALREFISSVVGQSQCSPENTIEVNLDDDQAELRGDHDDDGKDTLPKTCVFEWDGNTSINDTSGDLCALERSQPKFEAKLLGALREHVFNKMPIRLLCFEQHGSSLQISLLERGAIFAHIASIMQGKIHDKEFMPQMNKLVRRIETEREATKRLITKYTKYAILSHTWLRTAFGSEVTYADWNKGLVDPHDPGYRKLVNFCKAAWKDHQLAFGWMDTVCINKESSAELDESIRSMYNWYSRASVCLVYLAETTTVSNMLSDSWFTRGWTLQELLAPPIIKFYNNHWERLVEDSYNDKKVTEITQQIERATTISKQELLDIHKARISRRMQLAATREVTREEDTAYSLMGIFNVSISTAYGEGASLAFFRLLQEMLVSSLNVLEILNWAGTIAHPRPHTSFILPCSPKNFINRSSDKDLVLMWPSEPLTLSHRGLRVPVILMPGISIQNTTSRHGSVGDYHATVNITPLGYNNDIPTSYNLLDNRVSGKDGRKDNNRYQMTFAIFNFKPDPDVDIIRLPKTCISIGLRCEEPVGKVSLTGVVNFIRTDKPIVFELSKRINAHCAKHQPQHKLDKWFWFIRRDELENHGMQLITLYL